MDRHVRRSGSDYAVALAALLPIGIAWPRNAASLLMQTVRGLANVWGFVDGRAADLLERESDPRATLELLEDWERAYGLPDLCIDEPQGITARRAALLRRITTIGAQSREFFIDLAADIGYDISIIEYSPFQIGISHVGYTKGYNLDTPSRYRWYLGPPEMRFFWTVDVGKIALFYFHCAAGQCGIDPLLRNGRATDLECVIRRAKPAHTIALFDYSHQRITISPPATMLMLDTKLPTRVNARDPKIITPTVRDLTLSTLAPVRSVKTTYIAATGNVGFTATAPSIRVNVPTTIRVPITRDLALSATAPTITGAWTPLALTGLRGWYMADQGALNMNNLPPAEGDGIFSWQDQSGNNQHLFRQASPRFRATGLLGKPMLDFNVANAAMRSQAASPFVLGQTASTTLSIFAVAFHTSTVDGGLVSFAGSNQGNDYDNVQSMRFKRMSGSSIGAYRNNANAGIVGIGGGGSSPYWAGTIFANNGRDTSYSNTATGTFAPTSTQPFATSGTLTVGAGYEANALNRFWLAGIAEVVVTNVALTSAELAALQKYFRDKYGI